MSVVDGERLELLLGGEEMTWIVDRLVARVRRDEPLTGTVTNSAPTREERWALERLLGRTPGSGRVLTCSVEALADLLRQAEVCHDLVEAVTYLRGPVVALAAAETTRRESWEALHGWLAVEATTLGVASWADDLAASGLVKRLADGDPNRGRTLLQDAIAVLGSLPAGGVPLPRFAQATIGDTHGLDRGSPVATLVLRAVPMLVDVRGGERGRDRWAAVGVWCDELTSSALVLGLQLLGRSLAARTAREHAAAGRPHRLLLADLGDDVRVATGTVVHVCENPTIVRAAADELGPLSGALVCAGGNPSVAVQELLARLTRAGATIRVRADFDWVGVGIVTRLLELTGGSPWLYDAVTYEQTPDSTRQMRGQPAPTPWDPALARAIDRRGVRAEEEALLPQLIDDLRRESDSAA